MTPEQSGEREADVILGIRIPNAHPPLPLKPMRRTRIPCRCGFWISTQLRDDGTVEARRPVLRDRQAAVQPNSYRAVCCRHDASPDDSTTLGILGRG